MKATLEHKIKIALYTSTYPPKSGGIATSNYNIYNLLKDKYSIKVFVHGESNPKNSDSNIVYTTSKFDKLFIRLVKIYLELRFKSKLFPIVIPIFKHGFGVIKLNRKLRNYSPDVIMIADNFIPAYFLEKPKKTKLIWFTHNNYSRLSKHPLIPPQSYLDTEIAKSMENNALKKADIVVSPSEFMISEFKITYKHQPPIHLIYNFMHNESINKINKINICEKFNLESYLPVVYIPSAGSTIKGKRYVFEIVRRLAQALNNNVCFYLSGNIPSDLAWELKQLSCANILTPGHLDWHQNIAFVKSCTVGVSPNLLENFSNAIVEAQTLGIPFVAFDTGGNKEIIIDNKTGYIVSHLDIEALIEKTLLIIKDECLLKEFSKCAKEHIETMLNEKTIIRNYDNLFNTLLKDKE